MKLAATYMSIFALGLSVSSLFADDLPTKSNFDRYKGMLDHSPFAVATAVVVTAAPNVCKDLYIANAARTPDGDTVTLMSSADKEFKKYLNSKEAPVDGFAIGNIEWSEKVGETKVTISKDGQFCTLTFNQSLLSQPVPNKPGAPAPGFMPQPQQPGFKPFQPPATPIPTPHVRATIQRNPQQPMPAPVKPPPNVEE